MRKKDNTHPLEEEAFSPFPPGKGTEAPKKKSLLRRLLTVFFLLLCLSAIGYTALREFGPSSHAERVPLSSLNFYYLFAALGAFLAVMAAEILKYFLMIRRATGENRLGLAYNVAVLGKYYDNITPLGSGGQPFQIYHMQKHGVPMGHATAIPIAGFFGNQISFVLLALVMFITNGSVTDKVGFKITAYVGLLFYLIVPAIMLLFTFWPRPIGAAILWCVRLGARLHLVRDYENTRAKIEKSLAEYRTSIMLILHSGALPWLVLLTSLVYQVLLMSIPFFVLRAFGGGSSWLDTFTMSLFVYAAITCVPTPGNSGAAEGAFYALFSSLSHAYLFWAMLVWRFFVYYAMLALGLASIFSGYFRRKLTERRHGRLTADAAEQQQIEKLKQEEKK